MIVSVGFPEDLNGFVVVFYGLLILLETLFTVGQVGETLSYFYVEPAFKGVLFDYEGSLIRLLGLYELPVVEVNISKGH